MRSLTGVTLLATVLGIAPCTAQGTTSMSSDPVGCYTATPPLTYSATGLRESRSGDASWVMLRLYEGGGARRPLLQRNRDSNSRWTITGDSLSVQVHDGLAGWRLSLRPDSTGWSGQARYLTDAIGGKPFIQEMRLARASCANLPMEIPPRRADATTGTQFIAAIATLPREEREAAILRELMAGNVPSHLHSLRAVTVSDTAPDGTVRVLRFNVMRDYLAIGSDADYVRMPMNPYTAQAFCDAFGFVLPTRRMVNVIWAAARVKVDPRPLTVERESPATFRQHHEIIQEQLGNRRFDFVAGIKKDVVVTSRLAERPNRVAIYGWHYLDGRPIQPLYVGHVDWYVDYSHGVRPVARRMSVNGVAMSFEDILKDERLHMLLSDEGPILKPRY